MRKITTMSVGVIFLAMAMAMAMGCATSGSVEKLAKMAGKNRVEINLLKENLGYTDKIEVAKAEVVKPEVAKTEVTTLPEVTTEPPKVVKTTGIKPVNTETLETRLAKLTTRVEANEKTIQVNKTAVTQLRTAINKVRPRLGQLEDKVAYATPQVYAFWTKSFLIGSSTLTERIKGQLDVLMEVVKAENITIKKIVGYADTLGKSKDNQVLAQRRAESVKIYLKNKGLDLTTVKVVSGGETSRFGSHQNNRCVAIVGEK